MTIRTRPIIRTILTATVAQTKRVRSEGPSRPMLLATPSTNVWRRTTVLKSTSVLNNSSASKPRSLPLVGTQEKSRELIEI